MDSDEFQNHLRTISFDDPGFLFPNWTVSAKFFENQARSGRSVSQAVEQLLRIFYESHHVPVMQPAIRAVLIELLRLNSAEQIESIMAPPDATVWVIEALADLANSFDISRAIPSIVRYFDRSIFRAAEAIALQIKSGRNSVPEICKLMMPRESARQNLIRVLSTAGGHGVDIRESISVYTPLLDFPDSRSRAIKDLPWWTENAQQAGPIVARLKLLTDDPDSLAQERAGMYLAQYSQGSKAFESILSHSSANVRKGGVAYLVSSIEHLKGPSRSAMIDRLALYLLDPDARLREAAATAFDGLSHAGKKPTPARKRSPSLRKLRQPERN
ncbi:MAG: hypothetical protein JNM27_11575 [Leptospirales bacterium]|nr:hypothetical protein [Leptospirales bacterium]